jgi:hypothetical protein
LPLLSPMFIVADMRIREDWVGPPSTLIEDKADCLFALADSKLTVEFVFEGHQIKIITQASNHNRFRNKDFIFKNPSAVHRVKAVLHINL